MGERKLRLEGKIALVTGAGSGIGRAVAMSFAAEGGHVVAVSRTMARLEETVRGIEAAGYSALAVQADVTKADEVRRAIDEATGRFGALHIIFNGAGGSGRAFGDGPVADCTLEGWQATLNMNLTNVFLGCKYGVPALIASGGGSIINLSSVLGLVGGDADFATHAYAAAKAGIIGLTRAIAIYYAPQKVRCNALCAGLVATDMSLRAQGDERIVASMQQRQPLVGRLGTPEEIADAALFLASDDSRFITGVALPVDAGWTAQ
jgi:NAD(P)-dependent dehydrogenase (short-subunit alcohol dehydrogenase family)